MRTDTQADHDRARALRERIRANFDRGAGSYERFEARSGHFRTLTRALLEMAPLRPGARVLDVGCGTGASTLLLLEAAGSRGRVVGVDISLGMLKKAHARVPGAVFVQADACRLDAVLRGPFDAVVYNAVLFMLPDARGSLAGAAALLGSEGVLLASHLEGVYRASDRSAVPELLASRGLPAGRHAVAGWDLALGCMRALFERVATRRLEIRMDPDRFFGFYGVEPMSAGLLPRLPYAERLRAIETLAAEWARTGDGAVQVWHLACARGLRPESKGNEG